MENNNTGNEAQGAAPKEKKVQAVSISYTLKSQGENIKKLQENGIITAEEQKKWMELHKKAVEAYTRKEFGL